ncbi:MAG: single-stranded DNA-binding protein [Acidaminococcus sp.]|uniref:single-stranded DNA-binding protein n=1 Tax=Acidaminococcus sp. TaxID=1872103 RepID=UPI002A763387|nr:single-stranded DNA-binding protein [Acidaminococcus sp.]MDY2739553.1 single-stranded DNA-binding protein [Acidaminococcus sp.]
MNKIILLGRLTREPEARMTANDKLCTTFTLAVDRPFSRGKDKEADFINIVAWNKTAEVVGNSLLKGQRALVEGRLQIRSYDGKDGQKRWITEVIAERVEFVEPKQKDAQDWNSAAKGPMDCFGEEGNTPVKQPAKTQPPQVCEGNVFDDEIPF